MTSMMTVLRATASISALAAGAIVIFRWGLGLAFWSMIGLAVALMAFGAGAMAARRYYVQAATPSGLAAVVSIFVWMPPSAEIWAAVVLLFLTCGLAFYLYEVD